MTGPLLIDRISISAFRGVTQPLNLEFSAPVTLVFAPNGTGKTTFCEAVEWLLTGQVERLKQSTWSNDLLQSVFVEERPSVEGALRIGDQTHRLRRTGDGAWLDDAAGAVRIGDLLAQLAPAAAAPDRHHRTAISLRQHYLRGTRFLMSEALAALVDNDPDSLGRRKDVFADLLGIRHLRDAEQDSAKYADALQSPLAVLDRQRNDKRTEADELRLEIARASASAHSALAEVEAGEFILGLRPDQLEIDPRIQALAAACAGRRHDQEARESALVELGPLYDRRPELDARLAELRQSEIDLVTHIDAVQARRSQAENQLSQDVAASEAVQRQIRAAEAAAAALSPRVEAVVRSARLAEPYLVEPVQTLATLVVAAPEAAWTPLARRTLREEVRLADALQPSLQQNLRERDRLQADLADAVAAAPDDAAFDALRRDAEQAEAAAAQAARDAEVLVGPLATLQSLGREVLSHRHDDTDCPLCGQDWESRERLREAVERTLNAAPDLVAQARERVTRASAEAAARRADHAAASTTHERVRTLAGALSRVESDIARDGALFQKLGVPLEGDDRERELTWAAVRLDLAQALADLSEARRQLRPDLAEEGTDLLSAALAVDGLSAHLAEVVSLRLTRLAAALGAQVDRQEQSGATVATARTEEQAQTERLALTRAEIARSMDELTLILKLWAKAAGDAPWAPEGLQSLRLDVQNRLILIGAAEGRLAAARAGWDVELRQTRLKVLEAELAPLDRKFERLTQKRADALEMRDAFRANYIETSARQVDGLSRVVNALFLRMHANKIVEKIDLGGADAFLKWLADAGKAQLDPGRDFSQGQRQDLALALFLARARGLGGTFFLDEPVSHLDDLNRVGLMDVFRAVAMEGQGRVRLVITTASRSLARHMVEKFAPLASIEGQPALRVVELSGNGRFGVKSAQVYPPVGWSSAITTQQ